MAEIVPDLPVVGQDRDVWGDKLITAFLQTFEAVNGTVETFEVRGTDLWAIHVDGSDTKVGALPVGPGGSDSGVAGYINTSGSATQTALSAQRVQALATNTSVTWSGGLPATETLTTPIGNLVKTYQWDAAGNPVSCAWDMPAPLADLVETFTYDAAGNPTGSTFAGA